MLSLLQDLDTTRFVLEYILDTPGGRRSLGRLARTCKALNEPALSVLWKELDSLNPLLHTMPGNLFKRAKRPGLGFAKMPEDKDWERLMLYGQHVRRLSYNETAGNVHPSIFSVIEEYNTDEYILPNLRTLTWKADTSDGLERSLLFLTPDIQSLSVDTGNRVGQSDLEEFLTEAVTHTSLSSLSISSSTKLPDNLPRLLRSQDSLQKVTLMAPGALAPSTGSWLAAMPFLRSLQMDVTGRSDAIIAAFFDQPYKSGTSSPADIRTPDSGVFSGEELDSLPWSRGEKERPAMLDLSAAWGNYKELRHLKLTGETSSVASFLGRIASPIQVLELVIDDPEEESEWQDLLTTVQRRFRSTLQSLQVSATGSSRFADLVRSTARGEIASRRLALDSLRSLPYLRRLEIELPESILLNNNDISHVADACPNIEVLKLSACSRWPTAYGPPKLTLSDLTPLTARCTQLHTLAIPVHAIEAIDERIFDWEMSSRSLLRLHVGHSWVGDPLQAAVLLSHLAPQLDSLKWFHEKNRPGYIEANNVAWTKVSDLLTPLQRLRTLERRQKITPTVPAEKPIAIHEGAAAVNTATDSEGVLARPSTSDCSVEARPEMCTRGTNTEPDLRSQGVDATPEVVHQEVQATPAVTDESVTVEMQAWAVSRPVEKFEVDEKMPPTIFDAVGDTVRSVCHAVRSVSPPILVRLFDMLSLFIPQPSKVVSNDVVAGVRSPMVFSPTMTPACH